MRRNDGCTLLVEGGAHRLGSLAVTSSQLYSGGRQWHTDVQILHKNKRCHLTLSTKLVLALWNAVTRLWESPCSFASLRTYTSLAYAMATASSALLPCMLSGVACSTSASVGNSSSWPAPRSELSILSFSCSHSPSMLCQWCRSASVNV